MSSTSNDPTPLAICIETRHALQAVAEHVVCAARYASAGRIGLLAAPGGFAAPPFPTDHGDRTITVEGRELVVRDGRGERRTPLTTVRDAAAFAEIAPGAPTEVFTPTTALAPDEPLAIDATAAAGLAAWWTLGAAAFAAFATEHPEDSPAPAQLWPEHFDLGGAIGDVNYGASPGDEGHELPYLYVGPWDAPEQDDFWNRPFGALIAATEVPDLNAALDFFREGRRRLEAPAGA